MKVDAIVLAGGKEKKLDFGANSQNEAGIKIGGVPMLQRVLEALSGSRYVNKVIVVGSEKLLDLVQPFRGKLVPNGNTPVASLMNGLKHVEKESHVLVVTADLPFLTSGIIDDFLRQCLANKVINLEGKKVLADIYYPIVSRQRCDQYLPGIKRTYVKLQEGTFTGGNIFLLKAETVLANAKKVEQFVTLRKRPIAMARLLGWRFLWRLIRTGLSIEQVEKQVHKLFNLHGKCMISKYPEIGIDIDKPSDLQKAKTVLEGF